MVGFEGNVCIHELGLKCACYMSVVNVWPINYVSSSWSFFSCCCGGVSMMVMAIVSVPVDGGGVRGSATEELFCDRTGHR